MGRTHMDPQLCFFLKVNTDQVPELLPLKM